FFFCSSRRRHTRSKRDWSSDGALPIFIFLLIMILKPGLLSIIIAIAMTGWIGQSRIVRGQILKIKTEEYVLAARTLGAKPRRIKIGRAACRGRENIWRVTVYRDENDER